MKTIDVEQSYPEPEEPRFSYQIRTVGPVGEAIEKVAEYKSELGAGMHRFGTRLERALTPRVKPEKGLPNGEVRAQLKDAGDIYMNATVAEDDASKDVALKKVMTVFEAIAKPTQPSVKNELNRDTSVTHSADAGLTSLTRLKDRGVARNAVDAYMGRLATQLGEQAVRREVRLQARGRADQRRQGK